MSLKVKLNEEMEYYKAKSEKVEEEIRRLEKQVRDDEAFLDSVLDEIELGENLLKKIEELAGDSDGRN